MPGSEPGPGDRKSEKNACTQAPHHLAAAADGKAQGFYGMKGHWLNLADVKKDAGEATGLHGSGLRFGVLHQVLLPSWTVKWGDTFVNSSPYLALEWLGHSLSTSETKEDSSREGRNTTCPQCAAILFKILLQGETCRPTFKAWWSLSAKKAGVFLAQWTVTKRKGKFSFIEQKLS